MKILASIFVGLFLMTAQAASLKSQIVQVGNCKVDLEQVNLPPCAADTRNGDVSIAEELAKILFSQP